MDWNTLLNAIPIIVAAVTTGYGLYQRKRAIRAEVGSKEIKTADEMIELVKKAHEEAVQLARDAAETNKKAAEEYKVIAEESKKDNERLRKQMSRIEKALKAVGLCDYRHQCPVTDRLQGDESADQSEHKAY